MANESSVVVNFNADLDVKFRPRDPDSLSLLQESRLAYNPRVAPALTGNFVIAETESTTAIVPNDAPALKAAFPNLYGKPLLEVKATELASTFREGTRIGVVFAGRQAPGGHNVITGIFDSLSSIPGAQVLGFVGGTKGLFSGTHVVLTAGLVRLYRNQGGYDLIGRSVDQICTEAHRAATLQVCQDLALDGLVLVGSTRTATYAAELTEYLVAAGCSTSVVVVPGSIDGDMKNQFIETSFGFDTACKVYSELIGNIATDGNSAKKYYYFIRLMGRAPSHITLECALQTHPNVVLLGEEVAARKLSLFDMIKQLADVVCQRSTAGKNFGVVLLPEGLIESIPEMSALIDEINAVFRTSDDSEANHSPAAMAAMLTPWSAALFSFLPDFIQHQLLLDRDSNGSVQLTQIATERLLAALVETELARRTQAGTFSSKFAAVTHFFGYQARSSLPSNFDCDYAYNLGRCAAALCSYGATGYMASVRNLRSAPAEWRASAVPLTAMFTVDAAPETALAAQTESKEGEAVGPPSGKIRLRPSTVDLNAGPYRTLHSAISKWQQSDLYRNPGPIQFHGATANDTNLTLQLEQHDYLERIQVLRKLLQAAREACRPGCPPAVLDAALVGMSSLTQILSLITDTQG